MTRELHTYKFHPRLHHSLIQELQAYESPKSHPSPIQELLTYEPHPRLHSSLIRELQAYESYSILIQELRPYESRPSQSQVMNTNTPPQILVTTLSTTMSKVIPNDSTFQQFDLLRSKVKQGKQRKQVLHTPQNSQESYNKPWLQNNELSTIINKKKLGCGTPTSRDYPTHICDAAHKLTRVHKILKYEWKLDL